MTEPGHTLRDAAARVRLGSWMVIAGTAGTILAVLTYVDVWQVSDSRPPVWAVVAAACGVLTLAGAAVLWGGVTARSRAEAELAARRTSADPPSTT